MPAATSGAPATSVSTRRRVARCWRRRVAKKAPKDKSADRFKHRTRLEKIGVKPEWRASVVAVGDPEFIRELRGAAAEVAIGRTLENSDAIFFGAIDAKEVVRLAVLKRSLTPAGA